MGSFAHELQLNHVNYHPVLLEAADCQPGTRISFAEGLARAVEISVAAPTVSIDYRGQAQPRGPFGAIRLAVRARSMMQMLHDLRDSSASDVISALSDVEGLVVGLGWNSVNAADDSAPGSNPVAHAEMSAIFNTGRAIDIPVAYWEDPDVDLAFVELSSAENCETCHSRNSLWSATLISLFALLGDQVAKYSGFIEGSQPQDRSFGAPWAKMPDYRAHKMDPMGGHFMADLYCPGLELGAKKAFDAYRQSGARIYQSLFLKAVDSLED